MSDFYLDTSITLRGKQNITAEQYLKIVNKVKEVVLKDMDFFPNREHSGNKNGNNSVLGIKLRYRDDEDCLYADCVTEYVLFSKLHPYLLEHIKNESEIILGDQDSFNEPVDNKFYWSVTKFIQIQGEMYEQYRAFMTLSGDIIGVEGYPFHFDKCACRFPESIECFSDEQKFILSNASQISSPLNVILPYQPGDILYADSNPFGKPFYAVYCAETMADRDHLEWTKKEYGFYKREHPCLYISEDHAGPAITKLTGRFTDYISFPYSPLDRIQVVETCDDPRLLNASGMLKDNPDIFRKWCDRY